jgi:hypothetical protein
MGTSKNYPCCPIADSPGVNVDESQREQNGIMWSQFCGVWRVAAIFRSALLLATRTNAASSEGARENMGGRTVNIDDILATLKLPVLVAADRLILPAAAKYTAAKISGASRCTKASVMLRSGRIRHAEAQTERSLGQDSTSSGSRRKSSAHVAPRSASPDRPEVFMRVKLRTIKCKAPGRELVDTRPGAAAATDSRGRVGVLSA